MKVTKGLFGKIKSVEISSEEMEKLLFNEDIGRSFGQWLEKAINIEWVSPKKENNE